MKCKRLFLSILMTLSLPAGAQYMLLAGNEDQVALYLNPAKVWNYNHYEHSRWGAGLRLTYRHNLSLDAYLGHGIHDNQWKYGGGIAWQYHDNLFYLNGIHDYRAAGSHRLSNPWDSGSSMLGDFMASRMTLQHCATLGYGMQGDKWQWAAEITYGKRAWLFDDKQLIYINQNNVTYSKLLHLRLFFHHHTGMNSQIEATPDGSMGRLLLDYRHEKEFKHFTLNIYAQGGLSLKSNEYVDMFDLGGMWGSPLYLSNCLATAYPNEFTANNFALLHLQLQPRRPLYKTYNSLFNIGSNPSPFIGLTAAWGMMWDQDANGQRPWLDSYLQAPHMGILESTLGLNGIIHFGAVDWGAAFIYRITPSEAPYSRPEPRDNLILILTAQLTL